MHAAKKKTILIIDDEPGIRTVLSIALKDAGYEVITAERAKDGLALFRQHKPDLVLTDLIMPGRGGCEAFRVIKEESPHTPVALMTGMGDREARAICDEYRDVVFIAKPLDDNALDLVLRLVAGEPENAPIPDATSETPKTSPVKTDHAQ